MKCVCFGRMRMISWALALTFVVVTAPCTAGVAVSPPTLLGQVGGGVNALAVDGDCLYAGEGVSLTAYALDGDAVVSSRVSELSLPGTISGLVVQGQRAYVAAGSGGLYVVDVSNPASLQAVSHLPVGGDAQSIVLEGSVAYVSWANTGVTPATGGVWLVDISSPSSPLVLGAYATAGPAGVLFVRGTTLYVAWKETATVGGCDVVDVSTPSLPVQMASVPNTPLIYGIYATDEVGYVLASNGYLAALDLDNLDLSELLGYVYCYGGTHMVVSGTTAYITNDYYWFTAVDLSDPANMTERGFGLGNRSVGPLAVSGNRVYFGKYAGSFNVIDVTDPTVPVLAHPPTVAGAFSEVRVGEGRAYVIREAAFTTWAYGEEAESPAAVGTFDIVDTSEPTAPARRASYTTIVSEAGVDEACYDMDVSGTLACVTWYAHSDSGTSGRLEVVDVTDGGAPQQVATWSTEDGIPMCVTQDGAYAYVTVRTGEYDCQICVLDLSVPSNPVVLGTCSLSLYLGDYLASVDSLLCDQRLYVGGATYFKVVDVRTPSNPRVMGYNDFDRDLTLDMTVYANTVYATMNANDTLGIVDVTSPGSVPEPDFLTLGISTGVLWGVANEYGRLFVTCPSSLARLDITEPQSPVLLDTSPYGGEYPYVAVKDGLIYVADDDQGLKILDDGRRPLTIAAEGHGMTNPAPGTAAYDTGTQVTIAATPETGYRLDHWAGDVESGTTANPLVVTVDGKKSVTAVFAQIVHTLTTAKSGLGYTDPVPGTYTYGYGTPVTVTATPQDGWRFDHWDGDFGADASANPIEVSMTGDKSVTAVFAQIEHTLTLGVSGQGSTMPAAGTSTYAHGSEVNVTAMPADGWQFDHWEGDFIADTTANPITVTLDQDVSLTAVLVETTYALSLGIEGEGTISPDAGEHVYATGTQVTLTATPADGWRFERWDSALSKANTENPIVVTMDHDQTITAVFVEDTAGCSGGTSSTSDAVLVGIAGIALWLVSLFRVTPVATAPTKG